MRRGILLAVCAVAWVATALAEAPAWEELQDSVLLTRRHMLLRSDIAGYPSEGLWLLRPDGDQLEKLRPFFATTNRGTVQSDYWGDGGFLTIKGDRVHFQEWPYDIHFDGLTWRMLNRFPVGDGSPDGFSLHGPFLDEQEALGVGLSPGTYGMARCVVRLIISSHGGAYYRDCLPITVPGTDEPTIWTEEDVLLHDLNLPATVNTAEAFFTFPASEYDGDEALLSFDREHGGFWRGTRMNALFYPVVDGELAEATIDLDLTSLPFTNADGHLSALFYHPGQRVLYGNEKRNIYTSTRENVFFKMDPYTGEAEDLGYLADHIWPPAAFAAFGSPPGTFEQIVPIVADTPGKHSTFWTTDLWLYNPSGTATTVTLARLTEPGESLEVDIGPHASRKVENVLATMGGGAAGDGAAHDALLVTSPYRWAEQVAVMGRMLTHDPGSGGSYGHAVPAVPAPFGYSNHSVADRDEENRFNVGANSRSSHFDLDLREPDRFRYNLGVVNTSDQEITIELGWPHFDFSINFVGGFGPFHSQPAELVVPPRTVRVIGFEELYPAEVVEGFPPRIGVFSEKPTIIWMSKVDNLTGDATFVPFTSFFATTPGMWDGSPPEVFEEYRLAFPVVAHLDGRALSHWRTDLYGFERPLSGEFSRPTPAVVFHPTTGSDCELPPPGGEIAAFIEGELAMPVERWRETLGVGPELDYETVDPLRTIFPDVVQLLPECEHAENAKGGLEVLTTSWFSGYSRTYTTREDGGTYGAMLPLYPPGGLPVQHFAGLEVSSDSRINVGLFNGDHENSITHLLSLFTAEGVLAAQQELTLEPLESVQREIKRFFHIENLDDGSYGLTVLPFDDEESGVRGRSWAYVSVVDNRTNDPINLW